MRIKSRHSLPFMAAFLVIFLAGFLNAQDEPDHPDDPEGLHAYSNSSFLTIGRFKRWGCPSGCFSGCSSSNQCRTYNAYAVCVGGCCCNNNNDITTACSGDPAVAGCLRGLCGQGYYCTSNNYCCRCQSGQSPGPCVNGLCPSGYACNANNYCCSLGSGTAMNPCINNMCPAGFTCGAGNLCYPSTSNNIFG
uniref:Uncharacterized protein n=1 Tax=Acrobeloides nanus TaxID=290746 RepID=A0A914DJ40_9BILA